MGKLSTAMIGDNLYFDGETFDPDRDRERLTGQLLNTFNVLLDKRWHTIRNITDKIGGSEASISARIRDLRKPRFGSHWIERRYVSKGLWQYRMVT